MTSRLPIILILILSLFHLKTTAQSGEIVLNVYNQPLNLVLHQLQEDYQIQLSFNDSKLSEYTISLKGKYKTMQELLEQLVSDLPLEIEEQSGVFVIYSDDTELEKSVISTQLLMGVVTDLQTGESLPFSTVKVNGEFRISDVNGRFSFVAFYKEYLQIEVSHLGYLLYDTTIVARSYFNCQLKPVINILEEAIITGTKRPYGAQIGMSMGEGRMNPAITRFLPGGANRGVGQILDLQAGIQGAPSGQGGHSIWGGYPGHNQVLFDGIPIFTSRTNNRLSYPVNPFVVKDMIINKGAFGSNLGDRVGGILILTGKEGRRDQPEMQMHMDGSFTNLMLSTAVNQRSSLLVATRHSWFPDYYTEFANHSSIHADPQIDHWHPLWNNYSDVNLKYSGSKNNGDQYFISLYGNSSSRKGTFEETGNNNHLSYLNKEDDHQLGASVLYDKIWSGGVNTVFNFSVSHAELNQKELASYTTTSGVLENEIYKPLQQGIWDSKLSLNNRFSLNPKQFVEVGGAMEFTNTTVKFPEDKTLLLPSPTMIQSSAFIRNHIYANKKFLMDIGLRLDYHHNRDRLFLFPRIKGTLEVAPSSHFNFSWGIHQQYLTLVSLIDELGNDDFVWQTFNQKGNFLQSNVLALGWSFDKNTWNINAELYWKSVEGDGYFMESGDGFTYAQSRSTSNGLDIMIKKELGNHLLLQSYTYNNAQILYNDEENYQPYPYSRQHELKTTALFNFSKFRCSASYIYGSPTLSNNQLQTFSGDYKRLDVMAAYNFTLGKMKMESGVLIYNVLDAANASSLNSKRLPGLNNDVISIAQGGMPFYTSLFLHLQL